VPVVGTKGKGMAAMMYCAESWTLTATKNELHTNNCGIAIVTKIHGATDLSAVMKIPSGSVTRNNFKGNSFFGMIIADMTADTTAELFRSTGQIEPTTASDNALTATHNWWGHFLGPKGAASTIGRGVLASDKLTYSPFLACYDSTLCDGNSDCELSTAIFDPQTSKCVANAAACHADNQYGDMRLRKCVASCPNSFVPDGTTKECFAKFVVNSGGNLATTISNGAEGDYIEVGAGTFSEAITISHGVSIMGTGVGSTIISSAINLDTGSKITFNGLTIKDATANTDTKAGVLYHKYDGTTSKYYDRVGDLTVVNCLIEGSD